MNILSEWYHILVIFAKENPGPTIALLALIFSLATFLITRPDQKLHRRRIYMDLEFESSRIFRTCVDHPKIVKYLEGTLDGEIDPIIPEKVYWHVCQVLNTFELLISLYKERMVNIDVFSTWVSWFHELGTSERFGEFWDGRGLSFHYKWELQEIMDTAQMLLLKRREDIENYDHDSELGIFHRSVASLLRKREILEHFDKSQSAKMRRVDNVGGGNLQTR